MGSLCHRRLMRQRLPIDSLSLEQYTLARCVIHMWLTFWTVTIALALGFSVMALVTQNDSFARGR